MHRLRSQYDALFQASHIPFVAEFGTKGQRLGQLCFPQLCDASDDGCFAVADTDNHRIQVFGPNHRHLARFTPYGHQGSGDGQLLFPRSVKFCPTGFANSALVVADTGNRRVVLLTAVDQLPPAEPSLRQVASMGQSLLREPADVAIDKQRNTIYVADSSLDKVLILDMRGHMVGEVLPYRGSQFRAPSGLCMDSHGRLVVSDNGNDRLKLFDVRSGQCTSMIGQTGTKTGQFIKPRGVCADARGMVYIADSGNNRIQLLGPNDFLTEVVRDLPFPAGVAAHRYLWATAAEQTAFVKIFKP